MTIQQERVAKGQCPNDGKEAAPYRLCWDCRQTLRLTRALKRSEKYGVVKSEKRLDGTYWSLGPKANDPEAQAQVRKWDQPFIPPEDDKRYRPRLQGVAVDIGATFIAIMECIGRPATETELSQAWGKLRDRRTSPLPTDLARLIKADEKRQRKFAKRAAIAAQHATL